MKSLLLRVAAGGREAGGDDALTGLIMKCSGEVVSSASREYPHRRDEMLAFIKSRLWNRNRKGEQTISKKGKETSTNDILRDWDPQRWGIGIYIRGAVSNILSRDWPKQLMADLKPGRKSLDAMKETSKIEVTTEGEIVAPMRSQSDSDSDAPDPTEQDDLDIALTGEKPGASAEKEPEEGEREPEAAAEGDEEEQDEAEHEADAFERMHGRDTSLRPLDAVEGGELDEAINADAAAVDEDELARRARVYSEEEPEDAAPKAVSEQRRGFDLIAEVSSSEECAARLHLPENMDYQLFAVALYQDAIEPDPTAEGRVQQLRDLAVKVVNLHFEGHPNLNDLVEGMDAWDPVEAPFASEFPEVVRQVSHNLDLKFAPQVEPVQKKDLQLDIGIDLAAASEELNRQSKRMKQRPPGVSPREWEEIRGGAERWFHAEARNEEDLLNPDRPDYLGLISLTGEPRQADLEPSEMASELKRLLEKWFDNTLSVGGIATSEGSKLYITNYKKMSEMRNRMKNWDPMTGFAGEAIKLHLYEIRLEEQERMDKERQAQAERDRVELETHLTSTKSPMQAPRPTAIPRPVQPSFTFDETDFSDPHEMRTRPLPTAPATNPSGVQFRT